MAQYPSYLSQHVRMDNFSASLSGKITTSGTSSRFTFSPITGNQTTTFQITNKGDKGAYLAFGVGSATAVASAAYNAMTNTGQPSCIYIAAGAILVMDATNTGSGPINTIAAIQGSDTADNGATILEISIGYGQ